jgi:hypothetical protein
MTPLELLFLFGVAPDEASQELDPLAELVRVNHVVRKGKSPVVPHWLMKEVPRVQPVGHNGR